MTDFFMSRWAPQMLSVMRIIVGFTFLAHGTQKLFAFPPPATAQPAMTFMWFAGVLEFVGGVLLMIGLFTRPVAFILSGMMAVAYFMGHAGQGFWPIVNKGELAVVYCFVFLYLSAAGGGPWSLDAILSRRR
jgi:putative oxidoreductase